jgi:hypothetical protein
MQRIRFIGEFIVEKRGAPVHFRGFGVHSNSPVGEVLGGHVLEGAKLVYSGPACLAMLNVKGDEEGTVGS